MTYTYPGVYIKEISSAGPLQGVGTSTVALIGVAATGAVNQPSLVTSFDQFRQQFGEKPEDGFYLWYAARGFFENGGKLAYIVRASSGRAASLTLMDSRAVGAQATLLVQAKALGEPSPAIQVTVAHSSLVTTNVFREQTAVVQANQNSDRIQVAPEIAAIFRPGDRLLLELGGTNETTTLLKAQNNLLMLSAPLSNNYTGGTVRLANLVNSDKILRLAATAAELGVGSVIQISQGATLEIAVVKAIQTERISPTLVTYRVELASRLSNGYDRSSAAVAIQVESQEFTLTVKQGSTTETRANLSMAVGHPRYVAIVLAQEPFTLVKVQQPSIPSNAPPAEQRPAEVTDQALTGGVADTPSALSLGDYQTALDTLRDVDEVNFIAIPDSQNASVQLALLSHCETMGDRFAIFDSLPVPPTGPGSVIDQVALLRSPRGFGALYYPWIKVTHPDGKVVEIPPSGHIAGVYAKADIERGVHKAPANYTLNGSLGVKVDMNNDTQGVLNLENINVLRVFPGQARPVVWGTRTTVPKGETTWQYVNIRRLFLFLEESIQEGIRWAVFEPNNLQLWQKLKRTITEFLTRVWQDGGLFGATAEEAFYVRIDEALNPESEKALGRLYIEIGVRPSYPAEFIIVRIGIWQGGASISEG